MIKNEKPLNNQILAVMLYPGCSVVLDSNKDHSMVYNRLKRTNIEIWDAEGKIIKMFRLHEVKNGRKIKKNS